ncbi:MAG: hypothetical protein IPP46_04400 [Bacteroidetes bacterium]|nr:hypothetical protein [Bacteroidota bacterium]
MTTAYTDNGLNTKNNTYTYKVQTIDHCGYELPLDSSTSHTTINISAQSTGLVIQVSWTAYQDAPSTNTTSTGQSVHRVVRSL